MAHMSQEALRTQRQGGFAMVLQAGMNTLNPVRTIRKHFHDIFSAHGHVSTARRDARAEQLVERVSLGPEVLDRYPFELSGGMRQRVTIALALSLEPQLMVFDEPTTALDVLVQHAVMDTIRDLQAEEGFTALLISHDLGVVLESARRVLVMHDGRIVEDAPSADILHRPHHEYTQMLLSHFADPRAEHISLPGLEAPEPRDVPPERESSSPEAPERPSTQAGGSRRDQPAAGGSSGESHGSRAGDRAAQARTDTVRGTGAARDRSVQAIRSTATERLVRARRRRRDVHARPRRGDRTGRPVRQR